MICQNSEALLALAFTTQVMLDMNSCDVSSLMQELGMFAHN